MESLDKREEGFERAFALGEDLRFRARARRNRLVGVWAGGLVGLTGAALEDYAANLSRRAVESDDDEALVADLAQSLACAQISAHRIRRRLEEFGAQALQSLQAGR